jgi:hypothetical protein
MILGTRLQKKFEPYPFVDIIPDSELDQAHEESVRKLSSGKE